MIKPLTDEFNLHDSALMMLNISATIDRVHAVLYAPNATPDQGGRFLALELDGVLRLEFETTSIGEQTSPVDIYDVYVKDDRETERWKARLARLALPTRHREAFVSDRYDDVFKVVLASSSYRGWDEREDLEGISVVCRHYIVRDVTAEWSDSLRPDPGAIPGARV